MENLVLSEAQEEQNEYTRNQQPKNDARNELPDQTPRELLVPSRLCEKCQRVLRHLDAYGNNLLNRNIFLDPFDFSASASACDFCHFLWNLITRNAAFQIDYSKNRFWHGELKLLGDKDGLVSSLYVTMTLQNKYVYAHVAVHAEEETSPVWSSRLPPMPNEPGQLVYDLIGSWLADCDSHHDKCKRTLAGEEVGGSTTNLLPTRVLDVGTSSVPKLCLVETKGSVGHYCALSHCWGRGELPKTTSQNLVHHLAGIFLELPRTFDQAVKVTRGTGVRYLWIDSLCIIQDDGNDWLQESERMGTIYSNAYLTLAALSAKDASKGLFSDARDDPVVTRLSMVEAETQLTRRIHLSSSKKYPWNADCDGPLKKRAWALQEKVLSRRVVHFTNEGLVWTCHESLLDERNHILDRWNPDTDPVDDWYNMIESYTGMLLTHSSDRLVALKGLISAVKEIRDDRNIFGIWTKDIPMALLWCIDRRYKRAMQRVNNAPSWSWTSKDGIKKFLGVLQEHSHRDFMVRMKSLAVFVYPFGSADEYLTLHGGLFKASTALIQTENPDLRDLGAHYLTPEGFLMRTSEQVFILKRRTNVSAGFGTIGLAILDDELQEESRVEQTQSHVTCACLMSARKHKFNPTTKGRSLFCGEPSQEMTWEQVLSNTVRSWSQSRRVHRSMKLPSIIPIFRANSSKCQYFEISQSKDLYWVLILEHALGGHNLYRRIGIGLVFEPPHGKLQEYTIH